MKQLLTKTIILIALSIATAAHAAATEKTGPLCEGFSTVHSWENRNLISDAPALVKLPDGTLLCSVQLWSRQAYRGHGQLDAGALRPEPLPDLRQRGRRENWRESSRIPFATGKFLRHETRLYFIGSGIEWQGLWIARFRR